MTQTVILKVPESDLISWVKQLSPEAKRSVLKALIPEMDRWDALVDHGTQRMRELCAARGLNWDELTDIEREQLVDAWLHEAS